MSIQGFEILSKIGQGTYSTVYKVRRISNNQIYALKKTLLSPLTDPEKQSVLNEIRILSSIKSPNIISYKESFFDFSEKSLSLITEYSDSGDLNRLIQKCKKRSVHLSENFIWSLLIQLTQALKSLHEVGIIHRDVKSANVYLTHSGVIKLGDFNISQIPSDGIAATHTGTPYYASPEVWKHAKPTQKCDIWSLGCVIYESCALKHPFQGRDMQSLYEKIVKGGFEPIPKGYSKDLVEVLGRLLCRDVNLRPSCEEILQMQQVKSRIVGAKTVKNGNGLMEIIRLPKELDMISQSLPEADYEEGGGGKHGSGRILPRLQVLTSRDRIEMHRRIENSTDRLRRIKDAYLSPRNFFLSPQATKSKFFCE